MNCEFCKKADFGNFSAKVDDYDAHVFLAGGFFRYPKDEQFKFGPTCGEPLTEPQPLTLEQLSCMHGEPVYIVEVGKFSNEEWNLLDDDTPVDFNFQDVNFKNGDCYPTYNYGKTWQAFTHKPNQPTT